MGGSRPWCEEAWSTYNYIARYCPCGLIPPGPAVTAPVANPDATRLGGEDISGRGLEYISIYYCSDTHGPIDYQRPGFISAPSEPGGCDYNACNGSSCQRNLCRAR